MDGFLLIRMNSSLHVLASRDVQVHGLPARLRLLLELVLMVLNYRFEHHLGRHLLCFLSLEASGRYHLGWGGEA